MIRCASDNCPREVLGGEGYGKRFCYSHGYEALARDTCFALVVGLPAGVVACMVLALIMKALGWF